MKILLEKLRETRAFKELDENVQEHKTAELNDAKVIVDAINGVQTQETVIE